MNNFVQAFGQLRLLDILEVFLQLVVEVEDQRFRGAVIYIDDFLEGHLDSHINLCIFLHGLALYSANSFTQVNQLDHKIIVLDFFIHELVAFVNNKVGEVLTEKLERCWPSLEHVVDKSQLTHAVVADHVDQARAHRE